MHKSFKDQFGRIDLYLKPGEIDTFWIVASGIICSGLLRKYVMYVKALDLERSHKFNHVVDTSRVIFASPLNPFYLRYIAKLRKLNLYIVIVPSRLLRVMVYLTRWINRPDYVVKGRHAVAHYIDI